jgi:hypothetical protein
MKALDNIVQDSRKAYITHFEVWTILGQCMTPIDAAMVDGTEVELTPGSLFYIPPVAHDSWVIGGEPYVSLHFLGADHYTR